MNNRRTQHQAAAGMVLVILLLVGRTWGQNLFVVDREQGSIFEFTPSGVKSTFVSGLVNPEGLAFDSSGDLFVATDNIYEYTNNDGILSTNPTLFASGFDNPDGLAFNSSGDLFVANYTADSIVKVAQNGAQSTFASWSVPQFFPSGLAFNSTGDLFASSPTAEIVEITPTKTQTIIASRPAVEKPAGLAFNGSGDLFDADEFTGDVNEFTNNNGNISSNANLFASGLNEPIVLAFNNSGDLFVLSQKVYKYTPAGVQSIFGGTFDEPSGMAFQPIPSLQAAASNGAFQLTVTMPSPYYTTIVQASPDLVNWTSICTNNPPFTFTDSLAASSRFYRTILDTNFY